MEGVLGCESELVLTDHHAEAALTKLGGGALRGANDEGGDGASEVRSVSIVRGRQRLALRKDRPAEAGSPTWVWGSHRFQGFGPPPDR